MEVLAALQVLGLAPGASRDEVRDAYLRLVRAHHPDRADGTAADALDRTQLTAHITEAYGVLQHELTATGADRIEPVPAPPPRPPPPDRRPPPPRAAEVDTGEHDTVVIGASAVESAALLYEAAGRIGEVAYFDRQLGILETIVRFEGGPSCSVVLTVVPRLRDVTEVQCIMESIEASPTPPIRPVIEALVDELRGL